MNNFGYLEKNVADVRGKIAAAGGKDNVTLLAAVKYASAEEINYLGEYLGMRDIGINRTNQLVEIYPFLKRENFKIHFIGTLQTNKVKYIIDKVDVIESLDNLRLAAEIDRQAKKHSKVIDVLVEINSGREENKSGLMPEEAADFCAALMDFENLKQKGFMAMTPKCEKKEEYCKYFLQTYQDVIDIWTKKMHNIDIPVISMGMSDSFASAIECGANLVRVGSSLFKK